MYTLLCISAPDNIVNLDALYCSCIVVTLHDIKLLSIKEKKTTESFSKNVCGVARNAATYIRDLSTSRALNLKSFLVTKDQNAKKMEEIAKQVVCFAPLQKTEVLNRLGLPGRFQKRS